MGLSEIGLLQEENRVLKEKLAILTEAIKIELQAHGSNGGNLMRYDHTGWRLVLAKDKMEKVK